MWKSRIFSESPLKTTVVLKWKVGITSKLNFASGVLRYNGGGVKVSTGAGVKIWNGRGVEICNGVAGV